MGVGGWGRWEVGVRWLGVVLRWRGACCLGKSGLWVVVLVVEARGERFVECAAGGAGSVAWYGW